MIKFIIVFFALSITDFCWTMYLMKVSEKNGNQAGLYAVSIYVLGAIVTRLIVEDWTVIVPAALGSYVGTRVPIEWRKIKEK